jgi:pimeloyl-ACP methyl ester carboxylesterase/DNA-binding CsgD family transcriptional regulator
MDAPPIQYLTTPDGYNIAYCVSGAGRSLVFMPMPMTNLHMFWTEGTQVLPWWQGLAQSFRLIQYDGRGQGMSSRGLRDSFSSADLLTDLETIVDHLGLDRFALFGLQWSGHTAVRYASLHPERVEALILASCPASLASWSLAMLQGLAVQDWDAYLRALMGLAGGGGVSSGIEKLKQTVSQGDWQLLMQAAVSSDIESLLPQIHVPTLVLHPRESLNMPPEESMRVAALIPNAQLALIEGGTVLGEHAPGIAAIEGFLSKIPPLVTQAPHEPQGIRSAGLSAREIEVLRLLAAGKSNAQIADEFVISLNTVRRHVSNIFAKIGAANRAQAAVYARDHGIG